MDTKAECDSYTQTVFSFSLLLWLSTSRLVVYYSVQRRARQLYYHGKLC